MLCARRKLATMTEYFVQYNQPGYWTPATLTHFLRWIGHIPFRVWGISPWWHY